MRRFLFALIALLCTGDGLYGADAQLSEMTGPSWPTWLGPDGNSIVDVSVSPKAVSAGKVLWTTSVGEGYSATCVAGNYVFTAGRAGGNDTVVCLEAKGGKKVWSTGVASASGEMPGTRFMPVFSDGRLYCLTRDGKAFCLDARNGAIIWKTDVCAEVKANSPRWGFSSSAVLLDDLVLYNVGEWGCAVKKVDGKLVWESPPTPSGYSSFVPFKYKDRTYAAIFGSKALYVVDPKTGAKAASTPWITAYDVNSADPLVVDNLIMVTSNYGAGAALFEFDGRSLKEVWRNRVIKSHFSSCVYLNGYVYGNDGDANAMMGDFVCFEFKTGKEMWRKESDVGSLIAVKNGLLTLNEGCQLSLVAADPKKYTELASINRVSRGLYWPAPVLAGGRLYLRSNSGDVVCVDMPQ
jgi:outer membrane protein assembly factor BamB